MKKLLSLILALVLTLSLGVAGLANAQEEPIKLIWWVYTTGDALIDTPIVVEAANAYSAEKIGVTIDLIFKTAEQFNLGMTTGEYYDITFTCDWCNSFASNAYNEMFYDITDLVQSQTPALYEAIDQTYWDVAASINDRIYAVPTLKDMATMMFFRLDQERYEAIGMELKEKMEFADLEEYLAAYKENYDDVYPLPLGKAGLTGFTNFCQWIAGSYLCSPYDLAGTEMENKIIPFWECEELMNRFRLLHKWYELGYINPDAATTESIGKDVRASVRSGAAWYGYEGWTTYAGDPIFKSNYDGPFIAVATTRGAMNAINAACSEENAIAALKYLELLNTDRTFRDILCYGIEGVHFNYLDDGTVLRTEQGKTNWSTDSYVTGSVVNASVESVSENQRADPNQWERVFEDYENAQVSTLGAFSFDRTPVEAEHAACSAVMEKYVAELYTGTSDIDEVLDTIKAELTTAGYEAVLQEAQAQLDAYLAENAE